MNRGDPQKSSPDYKIKAGQKLLLALLIILPASLLANAMYLYSLQPEYSGRVKVAGLRDEVEVNFDPYGIPHIYGHTEEDVYFALGYVHAQERLFQMEMMRRVAGGRLSEIFGKDLIKTDKFFRTIGLPEGAERNAARFLRDGTGPCKKAALAYLAGINQYVENGKIPIEFRIIGIPVEEFTLKDIFLTGALMAFGFAEGFKMDPLVTNAYNKLGWEYLKDLVLDWHPDAQKIPVYRLNYTQAVEKLGPAIHRITASLPVARWIGSNGWVVSGNKSKSGKVVLANDTHMMYAQPSVWYEAHMEYPGFSFYGNHAAGVPFALIGHNRFAAWGLTMFENDDVDFYKERVNPENPNQVWVDDHWEDLKIRREIIRVKGAGEVNFEVRISRHGPILNNVDDVVAKAGGDPISVWWSFNKFPTTMIQAFYRLSHVKDIEEARKAASMIDGSGLNVMYGDRDGHIAWWAAAKLIRRPAHVNPKMLLDGASGKDEPQGYYDFAQNPQSEDPPSGFVYSANNQPGRTTGSLYPGYYVPEDRARRIVEYLESDTVWSIETMKLMITDCISPVAPEVAGEILKLIKNNSITTKTRNHEIACQILQNWTGDHQIHDVAPTIYYKLLANIMKNTFADELGDDEFMALVSSHLMKRTIAVIIRNDASLWWDNIHTKQIKESRKIIFAESFKQSIAELEKQLGKDISGWQWGKVHTLEHGHPLGRQKPLDKFFNVGPFPAMGGNETIANLGFQLSSKGRYPVQFGPAMRIILDFADIENSWSVIPTGQSGHFLSDHYDDQSKLFNTAKFRKQMMNRDEIEKLKKGTLILEPE
jgi:penicillin amidase